MESTFVGRWELAGMVRRSSAARAESTVRHRSLTSSSDTSAMELQAGEAAVADLKAKAGQLAEFAGRELGDLKLLTEGGGGEVTVIVFGVYELGQPSESAASSNGTQ